VFPWLFFWTPVFRYPYSGSVNQHIQPQTDWFVNNVRPGAGVPDIERAVVRRVASYGTQLGKLTDAVLVLAEQLPSGADATQKEAVEDLRQLQAQVKTVKEEVRSDHTTWAREALSRLAEDDPKALAALLAEFREG